MFSIVGCNHGIQPAESALTALDTPEQNEQRARFREMLETIYTVGQVSTVCEEWGDVEQTIAHRLALEHEIPWHNINTSNEDKDRMGIPRNYVSGFFSEEQKTHWNELREQFMLDRIFEYSGNAQHVLIVCGFAHLKPLSGRLKRGGQATKEWDYRSLDWYRPGVFIEQA